MKNVLMKSMTVVLGVLMCLPFAAIPVKADIGPKPSIQITFEEMGEELCYATLLSKTKSTGPASVWDGNPENARYDEDCGGYDIWKKFVAYEDSDGYYFLQEVWQVNDSKEMAWTYYPPSEFKILLYYPDTDTFVVSEAYKTYAFDSYYTVDMKNGTPVVRKAYRYKNELVFMTVRIVLTILVELAVALLFGYRAKKQMILLGIVNIITQVLLNFSLNALNYYMGSMAFVIFYVLLEIAVFGIEAGIYYRLLNRFGTKAKGKWTPVWYALVANAVSFAVGMYLALKIPGIF